MRVALDTDERPELLLVNGPTILADRPPSSGPGPKETAFAPFARSALRAGRENLFIESEERGCTVVPIRQVGRLRPRARRHVEQGAGQLARRDVCRYRGGQAL